jgi:hypothetical protein
MRPSRYFILPLTLTPCALVAQAVDSAPLEQKYKAESAAIEVLLKELKTQEAFDRVAAFVPTEKLPFNKSDLGTITKSFDANRLVINMHLLWGRAAFANGAWEKRLEILEKGMVIAKENKENLVSSTDSIRQLWGKVVVDSKEYIAKNEPRVAGLEEGLKKFVAELDEVKSGKKKLTKEQGAEFETRRKQAMADDQELNTIKANLPVLKGNIEKAAKVEEIITTLHRDADLDIKLLGEALDKVKGDLKSQGEEITTFNAAQLKKNKKFNPEGNKVWVDAVMRDRSNLTKLNNPLDQATLLNRLLVLNPGNKAASAALANLKAGRDPFFVEKPASKSKKASKQ